MLLTLTLCTPAFHRTKARLWYGDLCAQASYKSEYKLILVVRLVDLFIYIYKKHFTNFFIMQMFYCL